MKINFFALEYHLVDHCNLNCAGCTHFSPLAKERYTSLEKFEQNLQQLNKWNFEIGQFNLLGGEPLLHPQVKDFILIAKKYLNCLIVVKTNGILLDTNFISFCKYNDVNIKITNYTNIKYGGKKKNIFAYNYISEYKEENNKCFLKTKEDSFCSQLEENGDLHICGYSANIKHYNEYYNTNIQPQKNKDYFNIFDANIKLFNIWKMYYCKRPFCEYCRLPKIKKWHLFNKNVNEWKYNE